MHPAPATSKNVSDGVDRYLCVYQPRYTLDTLNPLDKLFPNLRRDGKSIFLLVAESMQGLDRNQEYFYGKCYIIGQKYWRSVGQHVTYYQNLLQEYRTNLNKTINIPEKLKNRINSVRYDLETPLDRVASAIACVRISRTGTTDLRYFRAYNLRHVYENLPENDDQRGTEIAIAQMFFFMKDIAHRHQHHDKRTDTITDIYVVDNQAQSDFDWRVATLYGIYRKVIEYKRNSNVSQFNDCIGLIAYTETFQKICETELPSGWQCRMPKYYTNELSKSILATQSKIERELNEKRARLDGHRNLFIGALGLIISYFGLLQLDGYMLPKRVQLPYYITFTLTYLLTSPIKSFMLLVLSFCFISWAFIYWRTLNWETVILRPLYTFPKKISIIILLIGSFVFAAIFAALLKK